MMTWQEWLGLGLATIGGYSICIALALTLRKRWIEHIQNQERQLRGMAKHWAANTDPLADIDAYFAQVDAEVTAEAARIAKREVRR